MKTLIKGVLLIAVSFDCNAWTVQAGTAYDGDTFHVTLPETSLPSPLNKVKIRIKHIDAPEYGKSAKCPGEEEKAKQAKDLLSTLVNGKVVELKNFKWDAYGGRIDADVFIDGINVAKRLLESGLVHYYTNKRTTWCPITQ